MCGKKKRIFLEMRCEPSASQLLQIISQTKKNFFFVAIPKQVSIIVRAMKMVDVKREEEKSSQ